MIQIPWKEYSELEIIEVLCSLFKDKGYKTYNVHKTDRSGEKGADIECSKFGETEKLLVAVKKKPGKNDTGQLTAFLKRPEKQKIYVHIEEPSTAFKEEMDKTKNQVSFWDAETLTLELFHVNPRFYLFLVLENSFEKPIFSLSYSFIKIFDRVRNNRAGEIVKANPRMLNLLWEAKDRSSSLYKSLRLFQKFFENMNLSEIDEKTKRTLVEGFLNSLEDLKYSSLDRLYDLFNEFIETYPTNFEQYCEQTTGRSNWLYFAKNLPELSPGFLIDSLEEANQLNAKIKEFLEKHETNKTSENFDLSYLLGDISRLLANEVMMFEETVDDLFSIAIWGNWDDMRDEFAKMLTERTKDLEDRVIKELEFIKNKIEKKLETRNFEKVFFSIPVFNSHSTEISHHIAGNSFLTVKKAYDKVIILNNSSNSTALIRKRCEETSTAIKKALTILSSDGPFDSFEAHYRSEF